MIEPLNPAVEAKATPEIGPGWYGLVNRLDATLTLLWPGYRVLQIKEKHQGLRYYIEFDMAKAPPEPVWDAMDEIITAFEHASTLVDMVTGEIAATLEG